MTRQVLTLARREFRGYLDQPTAYVLIVAFLGLSLFLAFRSMYAQGIASLRPLFDLLPMLFAVFIPAVTMRSLAEERRSKTLEWVLAQPITETELILGKFLGNWGFVSLALAGTLPTALGVLVVSTADPGIMMAQYLGAALLAAQFVALGLWASSFTRNQITAFIIAAAMSFGIFLIGLPVVQMGFPPLISGALAQLSVVSHFENVARGVVDLRDVLYFSSTAALFLILAVGAISRDRLSHDRPEYRRLRSAAVVVTLLVVVANLLGSYVRGRVDLTRGNLYTLAEGTRELMAELEDLVQIKLFVSEELPPEVQVELRDVRDLLSDLRRASNGNLLVTELDPDRSSDAEAEAMAYQVSPVEFNVLSDDGFQVRRGYYGLVVDYAGETEVTPVIQRTDDLEFRLASQIYKLTTVNRPGVAFVTGFGSKTSFQVPGLQESLADRYELRTLEIEGDSAEAVDPDSTRVLVVAGPTRRLDSLALARVSDYLDSGGSALFLMEPLVLDQQAGLPVPAQSGLEPLLAEYGISYSSSLLTDIASSEQVRLGGGGGLMQVIGPYPLWPRLRPASGHAITSGLNSVTFSWAGILEIEEGSAAVPLWQTSPAGGVHEDLRAIEPDQEWSRQPEDLAVRTGALALAPAEGEQGPRLVVVSDASFVDPQFQQANPSNLVFVANSIDWLAQDESLIRIRSKNRAPPNLVFASDASRNVLKWGNLVGVPILFVLFGILRVGGRRRRAEARWKEVVS
jgi:ABC-2 type transport system permease protein